MDPQLAKLMKQRRRRAGGGSGSVSASSDDDDDDDNNNGGGGGERVATTTTRQPRRAQSHVVGTVSGRGDDRSATTSNSHSRGTRDGGSLSSNQPPRSKSSVTSASVASVSSSQRSAGSGGGGGGGGGGGSSSRGEHRDRGGDRGDRPMRRKKSHVSTISSISGNSSSGSEVLLSAPDGGGEGPKLSHQESASTNDDVTQQQSSSSRRSRRDRGDRDGERRHQPRQPRPGGLPSNRSVGSMSNDGSIDSNDVISSTDDEEEETSKSEAQEPGFDAVFGSTAPVVESGGGDAAAFGFDGTTQTSGNGEFNMTDFGAFPTDFGAFPASSRGNGGDAVEYEPPTFGIGGSDDLATPRLYDKTPIDNPPLNNVESAQTKIKFISPRPVLVQQNPFGGGIPPPVSIPTMGHLIVCRPDNSQSIAGRVGSGRAGKCGNFVLSEWDPNRQVQVLSTPILTVDLQRKVLSKFGVTCTQVDSVLSVSCGLHTAGEYTRCRIAALIDLTVLEQKEVLRVIAIWQWGYGGGAGTTGAVNSSSAAHNHPVQLQSVLSPPSGSDFSFDTKSLLLADSCVFLAGSSTKGPCVFLSKPTVRETWSANFVGKDQATKISCMAVTSCAKGPHDTSGLGEDIRIIDNSYNDRLPYLAIALSDGTVSVWTYEPATKLTAKTTETAKRLLFPLCRLDATTQLIKSLPVTPWTSKDPDSGTVADQGVGICTDLQWVSPRRSSYQQLLLLAASFQGALCLYHVALPRVQDGTGSSKRGLYVDIKPPTEKTTLSQTVIIPPFCFSHWPTKHHRSTVSFVDFGAQVPPSLAVLMSGLDENIDYARLALVTCPLKSYNDGSKKKASSSRLSFHVWDTHEWTKKLPHIPRGFISASYTTRGILYYSDTSIQEIEYRTNTRFPFMMGGIGSIPFGLTTCGTTYSADAASPNSRGVLSIYTTYHCERYKSSSDASSTFLLEWTVPTRRHWLIETFAGDCKDATPKMGGASGSLKEVKDGDEIVLGGTQSKVLCEVNVGPKLSKLYPYRLARNPFLLDGKQQIAVWFRPLYGNSPEIVSLIEEEADGIYGTAQMLDGRDVVFLPSQEEKDLVHEEGASSLGASREKTSSIPQALLVNRNGGSVSLWCRKGATGALKSPWQEAVGMSCRPILGMDEESSSYKEEFVELRQFVTISYHDKVGLVAVGSKANGIYCIVSGSLQQKDGLIWSNLLPNVEKDPVLWLNDKEQVTLVVPLPHEGHIRGGLAVATTYRILIISSDLKILASVSHSPSPGSLVPLGSFTVAFCSHADHKLRYVSGLPGKFGQTGLIASFPLPVNNYCHNWMVGIRPDRFLYNPNHSGVRLVERGQPSESFLLPIVFTRPALLLEPLIANAIATGRETTCRQPFLRTVVEKFGRKVSTMSHGEGEGVGNFGAGMTPRVFELLEYYDLKPAASWLLTGTVHFDRCSNSRLLPPWMPATAKVRGALSADTHLHVVSNGDQYFSEYVKSPDTSMASTLPRPTQPASLLSRQFGMDALKKANFADALKLLDLAGTESTDALILKLSLASQFDKSSDVAPILNSLFEQDGQIGKASNISAVSSLAALAMELKKTSNPSQDFQKLWTRKLAPSIQKCIQQGRPRSRLFGESVLSRVGAKPLVRDQLFSREFPESKLVWNEGPNREKDNLLLLDHVQEWFGRRRPVVLGKEGAKTADDRGASTLADILNSGDDDSFGGENDDDFKDGWVDGVGEGLKDEDKLSAYFRLSEGDDEDAAWREQGFVDISRFENTAMLFGCTESAMLQESTSSVDEGEPGKVKALYDLVFEQSGVGQAAALVLPAPRGGSLDIGMMHGPDHLSRQRCTIEFWFWVPDVISNDVVLVRRTWGQSADDLDSVCRAGDKSSSLWELLLTKAGELVFRTITGKSFTTKPRPKSDDDEDDGGRSTVVFSRWNHVCITIKQESVTTSSVAIFAKGVKKANADSLSFSPPGFEVDDFSGASALDPLLEKSQLVFGLDHPKGFRLTEIRFWALERNDDDIRTLMTEYLECAETKKKLRVKIKKGGRGAKAKGGPGLAMSKVGGLSSPNEGRASAPPKGLLSQPGVLKPPEQGGRPSARKGLLAPPKGSKDDEPPKTETPAVATPEVDTFGFSGGFGDSPFASTPVSFGGDGFGVTTPSSFGSELQGEKLAGDTPESKDSTLELSQTSEYPEPEISPLWDSAIPLSEQVRSSAAAALIRGPPATRHFGGNRGGLPDYREVDRLGVGSISICGSEKTIVWRDDQVPPGLTYPIGASGAIVSDQMDEEGSEFLCCFLAKDKRMVVFELSTRTVVVELQMTTKLNYWRFLPPEAGEDTLCFMLVTPVGGFHWMPLDESPRPRQVWKRGPELQGKKIVAYEEGGTNGLDGPDLLSKVSLLLVTNAATGGKLEGWLVPICGDSQAICASDDILGACLCQPPDAGYEAWMPLLLFVVESGDDLVVCVSSVTEVGDQSVGLTEVMTDALIEVGPYRSLDYEPPALAMGTYPEVLCCSLGSTIVIIVRRKGLVVAYELAETGLELIAEECVGHYVVDAVMRYSATEGGTEIVLLMSDEAEARDGRVGTFSFRTEI